MFADIGAYDELERNFSPIILEIMTMWRFFWFSPLQGEGTDPRPFHKVKSKWDKKITRVYDILIKLAQSKKYNDDMEFECLKVIFIEAKNEKPDIGSVRDWIQNYLCVYLTDYEVTELVSYVKLLRPAFVLSEFDALEEVSRKRPLHINRVNADFGRDQWCYDASKVMLNDRKDLFIHRRRLSSAIARRKHSNNFSLFDKEEADASVTHKLPPPRISKLLGVFVKSSSQKEVSRNEPKHVAVHPLRNSVGAIHYSSDRDGTVDRMSSVDSEY